ncbi:MAG: hypothetical protein ACK5M1_15055 [Xanthomarina gelatinilytica]|uniref:hypothetical protein n=1 Tax=Xanthomarina gelatinilytica TaxID=1137281 RepID=UPI003A8AB19B
MTKKKAKKTKVVHVNGHVKKSNVVFVNAMAKKYSIPKLYIPKDKNGKPTVEKGKYWYVYYYFENPYTGKKDPQPIKHKNDINKLKTVKERKAYGKEMIVALLNVLKKGYSPFEEIHFNNYQDNAYTVVDALNYAFAEKLPDWKEKTADDFKMRNDHFIDWLKKKGSMLNIVGIQI